MAGHDGRPEERSNAESVGFEGKALRVMCEADTCANWERGAGCCLEEIWLDSIGGCLGYQDEDELSGGESLNKSNEKEG